MHNTRLNHATVEAIGVAVGAFTLSCQHCSVEWHILNCRCSFLAQLEVVFTLAAAADVIRKKPAKAACDVIEYVLAARSTKKPSQKPNLILLLTYNPLYVCQANLLVTARLQTA